jgi:hypothetical protein
MSFGTILLIIIVFMVGGFLLKTALRLLFYAAAVIGILYLANTLFGNGTFDLDKKIKDAESYTSQVATQHQSQLDQVKTLAPELQKYPEFAGKAVADIKAADLIVGIEAHPELRAVPGVTELESTARTSLEIDKKKKELDDQIAKIKEFLPAF